MTALPMERHLVFQTTDLDEACERVGKAYRRHRLDYAGRGRHLSARQSLVRLGDLSISYITYGEKVDIDAGEPGTCFLFHSIERGSSEMQIGNRTFGGCASMGAISSATLPLLMRWSADCGHLVLKVDRPALERQLSDLLNDAVRRPIEFSPELPTDSGAGASFRRMINFISSELERDHTILASPLGISRLEQMIMTTLLTALPNNYSAALSARTSPAAPRHVVRAEEHIRANAKRPISVGELAKVSGVRARTLFEGFQRFRGTTPFAMLKAIRLEHVNAELMAGGSSSSVTDVAIKWGFVHLGRFAQMYRDRYGELPSETLRRASHG